MPLREETQGERLARVETIQKAQGESLAALIERTQNHTNQIHDHTGALIIIRKDSEDFTNIKQDIEGLKNRQRETDKRIDRYDTALKVMQWLGGITAAVFTFAMAYGSRVSAFFKAGS